MQAHGAVLFGGVAHNAAAAARGRPRRGSIFVTGPLRTDPPAVGQARTRDEEPLRDVLSGAAAVDLLDGELRSQLLAPMLVAHESTLG